MPIRVRFTSGSPANGGTAIGFARSQQGVGLFFSASGQSPVANGQAVVPTVTAPGEFAFRVDRPSGVIWRSGPLLLQGATTDTYFIVDAGTTTMTAAQLAARLPTLPIASGAASITSLTLSIGNGSIIATGSGTYGTPFGPIPIAFTYVFTLEPVIDPADYRFVGGVPPAVDVRTISLAVTGTAGGPLGFLVNFFAGVLFSLVAGTVRSSIEATVQASVDRAVASALSSAGGPAGTIPTVETITIATETGVSLKAWGGFSLERGCASNPSGGSVRVRPAEDLQRLRTIRDRLLRLSPRGVAYIETFEQFNGELLKLFLEHEDVLRLADAVVAGALGDLPRDDPGSGRLSQATAESVVSFLDALAERGSAELKLTVTAVREEVGDFTRRPVGQVLAESLKLIDEEQGRAHKAV